MTKADNGKFGEENNTLVANGRAKPADKPSFATFIYNKQNGTFLGRSAMSWAQIILFYIIFYACLAAFWVGCLWAFLATIDEDVPRYFGKNTIIGEDPGVGYQPWLKDNPESTLIKFVEGDPKSYEPYRAAIEKFLEKYDNHTGTHICEKDQKNSDNVNKDGKAINKDKACRFDTGFLERNGCGGNSTDYGFKDGKPCVILSLNRLINWSPQDFAVIPKEVEKRYKPGSIAFNCEGISETDKEVTGDITYIPKEGIAGRYYPFAKMINYHQPFTVVKFTNLPLNRIVLVKCIAYAHNIIRDEESKAGMVTFELLRQQKKEV